MKRMHLNFILLVVWTFIKCKFAFLAPAEALGFGSVCYAQRKSLIESLRESREPKKELQREHNIDHRRKHKREKNYKGE